MQNFSLYNIRKTVRQAQNALIDPQPELLAVRSATTTDSWGPSTEQLEDVLKQTDRVGVARVVDVVFARIAEYRGAQGTRSRGGSAYEKLYYSAVHYVNSGSEWRIVLKCLKVVEYLILWGDDSAVNAVGEYVPVVCSIEEEYKEKSKVGTTASMDTTTTSTATTAAQLKEAEHYKAVLVQATLVLKLLSDQSFRESKLKIATKMDENRVGQGNGATLVKSDADVPTYMANFKQKTLDRSKLQNSNLKSEIKNYVGHSYHPKERRPGLYQVAGEEMIKAESLFDDDQDEYDYESDNGEEVVQHGGYMDTPYSDSQKPELRSTDSFGVFQESSTKQKEEPLLSFDEPDAPDVPVTPTTQLLDTGVFGSIGSAKKTPTHDLL